MPFCGKRFHVSGWLSARKSAGNNSLINSQHDGGFTHIASERGKKRRELWCVIILSHDTLGGNNIFGMCYYKIYARYTKKAYFMLSQECYVEYYVMYIHCNFPTNIKIAFIITCVKIYCACVLGAVREIKRSRSSLSAPTSYEHNF